MFNRAHQNRKGYMLPRRVAEQVFKSVCHRRASSKKLLQCFKTLLAPQRSLGALYIDALRQAALSPTHIPPSPLHSPEVLELGAPFLCPGSIVFSEEQWLFVLLEMRLSPEYGPSYSNHSFNSDFSVPKVLF